jgi:hypothetical protein
MVIGCEKKVRKLNEYLSIGEATNNKSDEYTVMKYVP